MPDDLTQQADELEELAKELKRRQSARKERLALKLDREQQALQERLDEPLKTLRQVAGR